MVANHSGIPTITTALELSNTPDITSSSSGNSTLAADFKRHSPLTCKQQPNTRHPLVSFLKPSKQVQIAGYLTTEPVPLSSCSSVDGVPAIPSSFAYFLNSLTLDGSPAQQLAPRPRNSSLLSKIERRIDSLMIVCHYFPTQVHLEPGVVAEFALLSGFVVCLFGFRLLRWLIFVSGFLVSGLITSAAFENVFGLKTWVFFASWIGFFVMGVAGGCVALAFFPFGVFLMGSLLSYAFTSSLPYQMLPEDSSAVLIVVLLGGFLAWLLVRPFAIVAISLMGSIVAVWGVGYFVGKYPSSYDIERFHSLLKRSDKSWMCAVPGSWWAYLAAMLLLFAVGLAKQCHDAHRLRERSHIGLYTGWRSSPNIPML